MIHFVLLLISCFHCYMFHNLSLLTVCTIVSFFMFFMCICRILVKITYLIQNSVRWFGLMYVILGFDVTLNQSINQSINTFITRHGTEARATVRIMPKQREMS